MTRRLLLEAGSARVEVDLDHGARLAAITVNGLDLLTRPPEPRRGGFDWGCFPMAPYAGRVRRGRFAFGGAGHELPVNLAPHAIHGTVYDVAWDDDGGGAVSAPLGPAWPFGGRAVQRFRLRPRDLHLVLEVHADREAMPASCGWHPWWRRSLGRGRPLEVTVDPLHMYERDAEGIPTGALVRPPPGPWDDCFTGLLDAPRLRWPGALAVTIDSTCDHYVVYDEPLDAVCVEPQTGPPDALNLGPALVEPGRPLVAEATISWEPA